MQLELKTSWNQGLKHFQDYLWFFIYFVFGWVLFSFSLSKTNVSMDSETRELIPLKCYFLVISTEEGLTIPSMSLSEKSQVRLGFSCLNQILFEDQ